MAHDFGESVLTLIVARNLRGLIAIASDTMLTEHGRALAPQEGVIKSCILPGGLCVSFANSPVLAARAFAAFAQRYPQGAGFADAVGFFEKSSADTGNDYILAFSQPPKLVKIADGRRTPGTAATQWIGHRAAYERFREYEANHRPMTESGRAVNAVLFADEMEGSPASDLYSTMRHVVADREVASAGRFVCVLSNRGVHFRHSVYSDMLYNWPEAEGEDFVLALEDQIDFGAAGENASYAVCQISTGFLGMNMTGFYLVKGRKLFLFYGERNGLADKCLVLADLAPTDIKRRLADAIGADLGWLLMITSSPMQESKTVLRAEPRSEGPTGVGLPFFCHANTFPPTKSHQDAA